MKKEFLAVVMGVQIHVCEGKVFICWPIGPKRVLKATDRVTLSPRCRD